jgi:uncharacterized membrane protein YdfJ with MMPL/SSD domain
MEVICLQEEAFYQLVEQVVDRIKEKHNVTQDKWVSPERAMEILNIKSKTTLQKLRDDGSITYTQPQKKIILYDYNSIMKYLGNYTKKPF